MDFDDNNYCFAQPGAAPLLAITSWAIHPGT
jgi:hypothetical protein